jgi:hypothetical protein
MAIASGVPVDPETEVLPLIGSQEGIAHLPLPFSTPEILPYSSIRVIPPIWAVLPLLAVKSTECQFWQKMTFCRF